MPAQQQIGSSPPPSSGRWSLPGQSLLVGGFWLLIALGSWLQMWLFRSSEPLESLRFAGVQWLPWVLLTPLIFWLSSAYTLERATWLRNLWIHLAACLVIVAALGGLAVLQGPPPFGHGGGDHGDHGPDGSGHGGGGPPGPGRAGDHGPQDHGQPRRGRMGPEQRFYMALRLGTFQLPTFWAVLGVAHALVFYKRAKERERRESELESHLTQARLEALRMQLNPHFLFNTLNSIASLVYDDPRAADEMIGALSDLLRLSLNSSGQQEVTLREELHFLDRYLHIEQARFGERLRIEKNIDPAALDALAPILILQPLVENAIKHGLEARLAPGVIAIAASHVGDSLHLQVADNGRGIPENGNIKPGVGLSNTRSRLQELYGKRASLAVQRREGGGFQAEVTLPWRCKPAVETTAAVGVMTQATQTT